MKAYKGFNKDMTCRGFQYEEGKTYKTNEAKLCKNGFHACINPIDCLNYYSPCESVYHEVELEDNGERNIDDTKIVGKKITIGDKLSAFILCNAHFEYVKSKAINEEQNNQRFISQSAQEHSSLSAGDFSSLSTQYGSILSAQNHSSLSSQESSSLLAEDFSSLSAQHYSSLSGKYSSSLAGQKFSILSAGSNSSLSAQSNSILSARISSTLSGQRRSSLSAQDFSSLSALDSSDLSANDCSILSAQEYSRLSAGRDSILSCFNGKCKAGIGSISSIANREWANGEYKIIDFCSAIVDGEKIKADTWYKLENGELVECKD